MNLVRMVRSSASRGLKLERTEISSALMFTFIEICSGTPNSLLSKEKNSMRLTHSQSENLSCSICSVSLPHSLTESLGMALTRV